MNSQTQQTIVDKWIATALDLETNDTVYIHTESSQQQKDLYKAFVRTLKQLIARFPRQTASYTTITPGKLFKDKKLWVTLTKTPSDPTKGYIKRASGEIERTEIELWL